MTSAIVDARWCPRRFSGVMFGLFCVALVGSLLIIANPGFFSHDELQKIDHVSRFGLQDYFDNYVKLYQGMEFGQPVRPVSFLVQGLVSYYLPNYPVGIHLVDVLTHWAVGLLLFRAVTQVGGSRDLAWIASIIFLCSPLTSFSVGWAAALMDRLYILFGLAGFLSAVAFVRGKYSATAPVCILLFSVLAVMSKETAVVWPAAFVIVVVSIPSLYQAPKWRLCGALIAWTVPIVLFLLYRAAALKGSFASSNTSPYSVSPSNILEGLWAYGIYPFIPHLGEIGTLSTIGSTAIAMAAFGHILLVLLLGRVFSIRVALAYVAAYFVFLAPLLLVSIKGSHYLYGSAIAWSVAIAALLVLPEKRRRLLVATVAILLSVGIVHSYLNQLFIYRIGSCMDDAMVSLESSYLSADQPSQMELVVEEGAPGHILYRLATGREQIGSHFPVHVKIMESAKTPVAGSFSFNRQCVVYKSRSN